MRPAHGRILAAGVAALILTAAATAPLAQAAPKRPAEKTRPAVATGTSRDPLGSWRLEGRRLTVRLPGGLVPGGSDRSVLVVARCGEHVGESDPEPYWPPVFADSASRRIRAAEDARVISAILSRDVAARTNYCALQVEGQDETGASQPDTTMTRRRGTPPGCRPGRSENVVLRTQRVLVTHVGEDPTADDMSWTDVYRACLLPRGQLTALEELGSGGGGGGGSYVGVRFASAGDWVAWSSDYVSNSPGRESTTVSLQDLRRGERHRPTTFTTAPGTFAATKGLAVASNGTAVWVQRIFRSTGGSGEVEQKVQVGWPYGRVETLDSWSGPLSDEDARALTVPRISRDGRTVTWREAGVERRAPMP